MILRAVYLFIILLISVALGTCLFHDSGYVLITLGHWSIETTLWVAIPLLLFTLIFLDGFITFFHYIITLPSRFRKWRNRRRAEKVALTNKNKNHHNAQ